MAKATFWTATDADFGLEPGLLVKEAEEISLALRAQPLTFLVHLTHRRLCSRRVPPLNVAEFIDGVTDPGRQTAAESPV